MSECGYPNYPVLHAKDGTHEHLLMMRKGRFLLACAGQVKVFRRYVEYVAQDVIDLQCLECRRQFERLIQMHRRIMQHDSEE